MASLPPVRDSGPIPVPWEGEAPAEPPEFSAVLRLSRSFALPLSALKPGTSSTQAACVVPAPSRSRLVVRGPWCGMARRPA